MLDGLRSLGLLHLAEKKSPDRAVAERFTTLSKTAATLTDYAPDKKNKKKEPVPVLSDSEFEEMYQNVLATLDKKPHWSRKSVLPTLRLNESRLGAIFHRKM